MPEERAGNVLAEAERDMLVHPDTLRFIAGRTSWAGLVAATALAGILCVQGVATARATRTGGEEERSSLHAMGVLARWFAIVTAAAWAVALASAYLFCTVP